MQQIKQFGGVFSTFTQEILFKDPINAENYLNAHPELAPLRREVPDFIAIPLGLPYIPQRIIDNEKAVDLGEASSIVAGNLESQSPLGKQELENLWDSTEPVRGGLYDSQTLPLVYPNLATSIEGLIQSNAYLDLIEDAFGGTAHYEDDNTLSTISFHNTDIRIAIANAKAFAEQFNVPFSQIEIIQFSDETSVLVDVRNPEKTGAQVAKSVRNSRAAATSSVQTELSRGKATTSPVNTQESQSTHLTLSEALQGVEAKLGGAYTEDQFIRTFNDNTDTYLVRPDDPTGLFEYLYTETLLSDGYGAERLDINSDDVLSFEFTKSNKPALKRFLEDYPQDSNLTVIDQGEDQPYLVTVIRPDQLPLEDAVDPPKKV